MIAFPGRLRKTRQVYRLIEQKKSDDVKGTMRYFVLSSEDLSDDMQAALTRGLGLSPHDASACHRHCERYGVTDAIAFIEELEEAHAALATARALGAQVVVDFSGRLCFDVPIAPNQHGQVDEPWLDDFWFANLLGESRTK